MRIALTINTLFLLVIFVFAIPLAQAGEPVHYDRIRLSAQAVTEVKNDMLVAILSAQRQGQDPGKLANEVNQLVRHALARCHQVKAVKVQTQGYNTSPVYDKGHRIGWRVSQSLQLRSQDPVVLGKLVGELQQDLLLTGMGYRVSSELRNKTENKLITQAITRYRARAMIVTRQLGHKRYRIVNMQINTGGSVASPSPVRRFQALTMEHGEPVHIEAGNQTLTVTASGVIELE